MRILPVKIVLLGSDEKHFQFVYSALSQAHYEFEFVDFAKIKAQSSKFVDARLIILNTLPYPDETFSKFHIFRDEQRFCQIPILAMVREKPPRLRYRLIQLGITDYLTIPFDKLDIQVRVRNLLRQPDSLQQHSVTQENAAISLEVVQTYGNIFREINQKFLTFNEGVFLNEMLSHLNRLCKAHYTLLFKVVDKQTLTLTTIQPEIAKNDKWTLNFSNLPILEKAIRQNEPTILNEIALSNPLVSQLALHLNIHIRSFIVFPVSFNNRTQQILIILKSDKAPLSSFHFLIAQHFSHLLAHFSHLLQLRKQEDQKMDGQIWKFYYDFLEQVLNQLRFGILVIGQDRRIKYLNDHAAKLLNVSSKKALYRPLEAFLNEETVNDLLQTAENLSITEERPEIEFKNLDGKRMAVGFSVQDFKDNVNHEYGFIISLKDITETKKIRDEMRRMERLASLGMMASGIAHEIRNPLAGIKAMVQTFQDELTSEDPKMEYLQRIIRLVNRLDELLKTLFSYARPPKPNRCFCDFETILADVISLARQKFREKNIRFSEPENKDFSKVFVDSAQIQQVLVNLLLNSIDAVNENGVISISIRPFSLGDNAAIVQQFPYTAREKKIQKYLEILIEDDGCGIAPQDLKQIFNPFFTTKSFGTGLGLSIVYQIVKENDGYIFYESEVGKGTRCFLFLPIENTTQIAE